MTGDRAIASAAMIGTGIMGAPLARRLAAAGLATSAWNRSAAKAADLAACGVRVHDSAAQAAAGCDVVISMLSSGAVNEEVLLGEGGVLAAMRPGAVLAVMSSIPVETARRLERAAAARGVRCLDAPVSGGEKGAIEGSLSIMVGGAPDVFEMMEPVFRLLGRPTHIGPPGAGQLAKLCNQLIVASTLCAVAEGLVLAERGGADPARVREALLGGFADSTVLRQHGARMVEGRFDPGGPAKYQVKDTTTALAMADEVGADLPVARVVDALFAQMVAQGDGDLDHSGIIREIRRRSKQG